MRGLVSDIKKNSSFYFFIMPYLIMMVLFLLIPFCYSLGVSFSDWNGTKVEWGIGFDNYKNVLSDPIFGKSLWNTLYIGIIHLPIEMALAILFAVMLNQTWLRISNVYRAALFLPSVTSLVIVAMIFSMLMDKDFGIFNLVLSKFGVEPISWLLDPKWSKMSIVIFLLWRWVGYITIMILSGLKSISEQLYESARIDGAGGVKAFFHITLPLLKPVLLFALVMGISGLFSLFSEPYMLTGGGPANSSITTGLYLYREGFQYFHYGRASAVGYVIFFISLVFSLIQFKLLTDKKEA